MFSVFDSISDWYKTQEMCDRVACEYRFLIAYSPDKYKAQISVTKLLMIVWQH